MKRDRGLDLLTEITRERKDTEIKALAAFVAKTSRDDKTKPPAEDLLRYGWSTDLAFKFADAFFTDAGRPADYAKLARLVSAQVSDLPEAAVMAMLAEIRGERLQLLTDRRRKYLRGKIEKAEAAVSALPEGFRRMRCHELLEYHISVLKDAEGDFVLAADFARKSADIARANGNKPGEAIGFFLEAVYQLKAALCEKEPGSLYLSVLEKRYAELVEAVRNTTDDARWRLGNGPCAMIEACILLGRTHPQWDDWVNSVAMAAPQMGDAWKPAAEFVQAVNQAKRDFEHATEILISAANASKVDAYKASLLLILLRLALSFMDMKLAHKCLLQMPKTGNVRHIRAIAERLLKA